jgi:hypothetical protein
VTVAPLDAQLQLARQRRAAIWTNHRDYIDHATTPLFAADRPYLNYACL